MCCPGAAPTGTEVVVLGSSVGWVAVACGALLPNATRTLGVEILRRRVDVAVAAAAAAAEAFSGSAGGPPVYVCRDAQRLGVAEYGRAALVWDSLGFGDGVRADLLATVARDAPRGCVDVGAAHVKHP